MMGKGLEAVGIACVLIGLVHGIASSDMWGELYFLIAGMAVFSLGRVVEKKAKT